MTKLNLISPKQKDTLTVDYLHRLIENVLGIFVIVAVVFAIILIPLSENLAILDYQNQHNREIATSKNQDITRKIGELNGLIGAYSDILADGYHWSPLLVELASAVPSGITLKQFTASSDGNNFIIRGFALKRDDLIELIDSLETSDFFAEIESPLNNYLQQENINFEIQGHLVNIDA